MANADKPLVIKRYASRRLYNTETSDYVTLDHVARLIRDGRKVTILDQKSGDDLTRHYLLQIITEHEARGDHILSLEMLTELVRSYPPQGSANAASPHILPREVAQEDLIAIKMQLADLQEKLDRLSR